MSKLDVAKTDTQYEDGVVSKVQPERDGHGWAVTFEDGWSLLVQDDLGLLRAPEPRDVLRKFGRGIGFSVRGIGLVVGGELAGLYRYETEQEEKESRVRYLAVEKARKQREWESGAEAFAARVKALPQAFRERIEFFMRRQSWGPEYGGYELFSCEEAVKIARHVGDVAKIQAFHGDTREQKRAGISEEHSGNTFGTACRLASAFLQDEKLVLKMHGALCPLVGCEEYGCYSTGKAGGFG